MGGAGGDGLEAVLQGAAGHVLAKNDQRLAAHRARAQEQDEVGVAQVRDDGNLVHHLLVNAGVPRIAVGEQLGRAVKAAPTALEHNTACACSELCGKLQLGSSLRNASCESV